MKLRDLVKVLSNSDRIIIQSCSIYVGKLGEFEIDPDDLDREVSLVRPCDNDLVIILNV